MSNKDKLAVSLLAPNISLSGLMSMKMLVLIGHEAHNVPPRSYVGFALWQHLSSVSLIVLQGHLRMIFHMMDLQFCPPCQMLPPD